MLLQGKDCNDLYPFLGSLQGFQVFEILCRDSLSFFPLETPSKLIVIFWIYYLFFCITQSSLKNQTDV